MTISVHKIFIVLLMAFYCVSAQVSVNSYMNTVLTHLVQQRYDAAEEVVKNILTTDSKNFDALYMQFTIEQTRLLDYESYVVDGAQLLDLGDSICSILKHSLSFCNGADSIRCLFYLGNLYGGRSLILAKTGNWLAATSDAMTSVSILKQVKHVDSDFYAAYLGIGVFNYYLSQNLCWLPSMINKADEGLREIEIATQAKFPFNYAAKSSLAWILIERGDYKRADSLVNTVLKDSPENTIFLRIKARIALWTQKYSEAIVLGEKLASLSINRSPTNWSDLLCAYQIIVESYDKLGNVESCRQSIEKAFGFEVPRSAQKIPYVKKHVTSIQSVAKKHRIRIN